MGNVPNTSYLKCENGNEPKTTRECRYTPENGCINIHNRVYGFDNEQSCAHVYKFGDVSYNDSCRLCTKFEDTPQYKSLPLSNDLNPIRVPTNVPISEPEPVAPPNTHVLDNIGGAGLYNFYDISKKMYCKPGIDSYMRCPNFISDRSKFKINKGSSLDTVIIENTKLNKPYGVDDRTGIMRASGYWNDNSYKEFNLIPAGKVNQNGNMVDSFNLKLTGKHKTRPNKYCFVAGDKTVHCDSKYPRDWEGRPHALYTIWK
jgi:hypothetical protein